MTLHDILVKYFRCKKPFLKRRKISHICLMGETPEPAYTELTNAGSKAYGELTDLMYDLGALLGDKFNANFWVEELNSIMEERY